MLVSKLALGAAAVPLAIGGVASTVDSAAQAHQGRHHNMPVEVREAIESNDYAAWYSAVTANEKNPFAAHADEEVFAAIQDIHSLYEAGDKDAAHEARKALAEELGIDVEKKKRGRRFGMGEHHERPDLSEEARQELQQAMESGDYDVWLEVAREYLPEEHVDHMTEERFEKMRERKPQFHR